MKTMVLGRTMLLVAVALPCVAASALCGCAPQVPQMPEVPEVPEVPKVVPEAKQPGTPVKRFVGGGPDVRDPRFGTFGVRRFSFGCEKSAHATAFVTESDGGFFVGGSACGRWVVSRHLEDGALNPAFRDAGFLTLMPQADDAFYEVAGLKARPDGNLVAHGHTPGRDVVRLISPSGVEDPTFTSNADAALVGRFSNWVQATAVLADGKVLVGSGDRFMRLNLDGTRDSTFTAEPKLFGSATFLLGTASHPDGRIALAGIVAGAPTTHGQPFVAVLRADGSLDAKFAPVKLPVGTWEDIAVAFHPNGKLLVAGGFARSSGGTRRPVIWRFTADGVPDDTFGNNGVADAAPAGDGDTQFVAIKADATGRIVAAGYYSTKATVERSWMVSRFTADGALDTTFANEGTTVFDVGLAYLPGGVEALAVTPQGYLLGGRALKQSTPGDLALVRLIP